MKVYLNDQWQDATVQSEVFEPGFLFGWGVFEPLRTYNGKPAFLDEHLHRLSNSAKLLNLSLPDTDWPGLITAAMKENDLTEAYIRLTVYKKRKGIGTIVYANNFAYYASKAYDNGFTAVTSTIRRDQNDIACKVKTISYLNNRLAWDEAQAKGKDEALMLNLDGNLADGSRSNVFILDTDGKVITPCLEYGAFCGVTRQKLIEIMRAQGAVVEEKMILPADLAQAKEVFISSSLLEVMPIVTIDEHTVGEGKPGDFSVDLRRRYQELLHG